MAHDKAQAFGVKLAAKIVQAERNAKKKAIFVCNPEAQPVFAEHKRGKVRKKFSLFQC
jgi:hypothetical protein